MSKKDPKPMKDLAVPDGADIKGGADPLRLLAQVSHLQAQDASSSVKQVAASQRAKIK
jgi:hypothetical protein